MVTCTSQKLLKDFDTNNLMRVARPPYSPDLAPSDFWCSGYRKSPLAVCKFNEPAELLEAITVILDEVPREKLDYVFIQWIARVGLITDANGDSVRQ
jgi:hypothetical protein